MSKGHQRSAAVEGKGLSRYRGPVLLALVGGAFLWYFFPGDRNEPANEEAPPKRTPVQATFEDGRSSPRSDPSPAGSEGGERKLESLETLSQLLPDWIREGGAQYQDQRVIDGHTVLRTRARYQWEGGQRLEIEITDLGAAAGDDLAKSLGFDLELADTDSDAGYTYTQDSEGVLLNAEYDHNDQAGSLQVIFEGRYLIEIQVENLPQEAFQEVLDVDVPFDELFRRLEE